MVVDGIVITTSMITAQLARFGPRDITNEGRVQLDYWFLTVALATIWWILLGIGGARDIRMICSGGMEFKRVFLASVHAFGVLAILSYAFQISTARGYVAIALPVGLFLLLATRAAVRWLLVSGRRRGQYCHRVVILGGPEAVLHLFGALSNAPAAGYVPVASILPQHDIDSQPVKDLPLPVASVSEELDEIVQALKNFDADVLIISAGSRLNPGVIRQLGWKLHELGISLIVAPALTDIAGPRIHMQPVAGLPLIHVSTPRLDGGQYLLKRTFDVLAAGVGALLLLPVFIFVAILVKITSPGPIFYAQNRVGQRGAGFSMFKFRSMCVGADDRLPELLATQGTADRPLFKVQDDPRITVLGRFIRKYSIDELPQLLNVFNGTMSLVGPRPQCKAEVALYDHNAHRRLMVKPGMSGLWQVNGRSSLTWEQALRWDLYYVENWSLGGDMAIVLRTFRAVIKRDGAV